MSIQSIGTNALTGQLIDDGATTTPLATTISVTSPGTNSATGIATTGSTETGANNHTQTPTQAQITKAVQDLNKSVQTSTPGLEFSLDATNNQMVIKVVDQETNKVLMQIPNQEIIDMSQSLDKLQGLLVKLKA